MEAVKDTEGTEQNVEQNVEGTQEHVQDPQEMLNEGDSLKIIVTESNQGELSIKVLSASIDVPRIVGMLECAKHEVLMGQSQGGRQPQVIPSTEQAMVVVELDELDFEMDTMGFLKGKSLGESITMPAVLLELRNASREQYAKSKEQGSLSEDK